MIEDKLKRIAKIWNYYILEHKLCSSKIKFTDDVKTNYFGAILGYFQDTLDIVFTNNKHSNYTNKFAFTISFLQAIYIHQDFTQEMLEIFKPSITKEDLKQDPSYYINRNIRNELVGHPIRKIAGRLISSTLFSYRANEDEIEYLRYHKDKNFKFKSETIKIADIQERHRKFLEKYLNIILEELMKILDGYLREIDIFENEIKGDDFKSVLNYAEFCFETIFKSDYVYDKESLIKIYDRKDEHRRYKNYIDRFNKDLLASLSDKKTSIKKLLEGKSMDGVSYEELPVPEIVIVYANSDHSEDVINSREINYLYEIEKIATKRNSIDFKFNSRMLKTKCHNNELVLKELEHMEKNISDDIEYYTSLRLICAELNVD